MGAAEMDVLCWCHRAIFLVLDIAEEKSVLVTAKGTQAATLFPECAR